MVSTLNLQADACHVIHLVSKVLFLSYYAESKRISLITIFFVTTFFVVTAKVMFYLYPAKFLGPKMTERFDSLSIVRFFQVGL